jgi:uncharacterized membrane-anchored protein YitT (DUF2179 family)
MASKIIRSTVTALIKEYAFITLGVVSYALGWSIFLLPNNLIGGGVSGFASILYYATGVPMGLTYFIINVLLLLLGTKILGTGFGGKTIYAIIMTSAMLSFMPTLIPAEFIREFALSNGKLLCTIIGGVIAGFGIGLSIGKAIQEIHDMPYSVINTEGGVTFTFDIKKVEETDNGTENQS